MTTHKVTEVLNGGFIIKLIVPAVDLDAIEQFVGKWMSVKFGDCVIIGELKKVTTTSFKPKGAKKDDEKEAFKEIQIDVEQINGVSYDGEVESQYNLLRLPDHKDTVDYEIDFNYGGDN